MQTQIRKKNIPKRLILVSSIIKIAPMNFNASVEKQDVFRQIKAYLKELDFRIINIDSTRPWGGFFVIDETQSEQFIKTFFSHRNPADFEGFSKLSPKILLVAPGKRLSWQYHFRRSEIWKVIGGGAAIVVSETDDETPLSHLDIGTVIELKKGMRHRLIGTKNWGIIAEIWEHTNPEHPSDEEDIVRLQDDFGR